MTESADLEKELWALGRTMIIEPPPDDLVERVLGRISMPAPRRSARDPALVDPLASATGGTDHRGIDHRAGPDAAGAGRGQALAATGRSRHPNRTPTGDRSDTGTLGNSRTAAPHRAHGDVAAGPTPGDLPDRRAGRAGPSGSDLGVGRPAGRLDGLGIESRPAASRPVRRRDLLGLRQAGSRAADVRRRRRPGRGVVRRAAPDRLHRQRRRRAHRTGADGRPVPGLATGCRRAEDHASDWKASSRWPERSRSPSPSAEGYWSRPAVSARPLPQQLACQQGAAGRGDRENGCAGERDREQQEGRDRESEDASPAPAQRGSPISEPE